MTKKKVTLYVCNGCGFETTFRNADACPGCGHNTKPIYRKLEEDTPEGEDTP